MSEPFIGQITLFPYSFAPLGWADCAGQLLPIRQNAALFSLLGTYYGGNGTTTFALPNLQGRVAISQGQGPGLSPYSLGEMGGVETVTLNPGESAIHTHSLNAASEHGSANTPAGNLLATALEGTPRSGNRANIYNPATPDTTLAPVSITPAGSGQPHNNVQPFLALRYCIAVQGMFPPRP